MEPETCLLTTVLQSFKSGLQAESALPSLNNGSSTLFCALLLTRRWHATPFFMKSNQRPARKRLRYQVLINYTRLRFKVRTVGNQNCMLKLNQSHINGYALCKRYSRWDGAVFRAKWNLQWDNQAPFFASSLKLALQQVKFSEVVCRRKRSYSLLKIHFTNCYKSLQACFSTRSWVCRRAGEA